MIELGKKESSKGKGKPNARAKVLHKGKRRGKAKVPEVKHSRARLKACDPFSGRQYKQENEDEINLEPDESEMEDYVDTMTDDTTKYASYREKPKYRRDSRFGVFCSLLVVLADELSDMKGHKKEKPTKPDLVCVLSALGYTQDLDQRQEGESVRDFYKRMRKEKHQIRVEEIRRAKKTSDKKKRYVEKKKLLKQQKVEADRAEREEHDEEIRRHTTKGLAEQAERPPQLSSIIEKMIKNNKAFEREKSRLKVEKPTLDRKTALSLCRRNMDRFD